MNNMTPRRMEWVNYHHLLYFWVVSREGGLVPAGKVLRLSHPTLSAQIHALEDQLGEKLFTKVGRKLALTEVGKVVFRYADEIFTLGREMLDTVKDRSTGKPLRLDVGVVDVVPKLVVRRLLQPALALAESVKIVCYEAPYEKLLADLAVHTLDIVIADSPVPSGSSVRAFNHLLGDTGVTFFGAHPLVSTLKRGFPKSLDGAPMVLPIENTALRRGLNHWFDRHGVKPRVVAEFEDSALLKVFGADGLGIFAAPTVVQKEVCQQYGVKVLGHARELRESFYAVSVERRLKHPAAVAISDARHELFAPGRPRVPRRGTRAL
ncbi:MAG TPA: transcriptional activator NhaR [Polyangiaceae bacterium]|nr:transcriptional activator NhaR [Polyangiaceae bacterium]